jgi:hypothetical protein
MGRIVDDAGRIGGESGVCRIQVLMLVAAAIAVPGWLAGAKTRETVLRAAPVGVMETGESWSSVSSS